MKNLEEAKAQIDERMTSWCPCYQNAQKRTGDRAVQTTRCMDLLPGAKFEIKLVNEAVLNAADARALRSYTIQARRKAEVDCR